MGAHGLAEEPQEVLACATGVSRLRATRAPRHPPPHLAVVTPPFRGRTGRPPGRPARPPPAPSSRVTRRVPIRTGMPPSPPPPYRLLTSLPIMVSDCIEAGLFPLTRVIGGP